MRHLLSLLLCYTALQVAAQSPAGKNYALFVVITEYDHWTLLPGIDTVPRNIASDLENNYNFEKVDFRLNLTKTDLVNILLEYRQRKFEPNDQLLVYFSMHGYFDQTLGAIIPKNGKLNDQSYESWIPHSLLESYLTQIPCKHILFSLDACYSGTFGPKHQGIPGGTPFRPGEDCASKIEYLMQFKSRRFLTSGGEERVPTDSHFAQKWLEALRTRNEDGIMNFYELSSVLVEAYPKPYPGDFKLHEGGGDFLFIRKDACSTDTTKIDYDLKDWQYAQQTNTIQAYEFYLEAHPKGRYKIPAEQALYRLREDIFWQQTQKISTPEACKQYLAKYPKGRYRTEAENCVANKTNDVEVQMVFIAGGAFQMGCDSTQDADCLNSEKPVRTLTLSPYYLGKYEVTVAQFKTFVDAVGYKTEVERRGDAATIWTGTKWENKPGINWRCDEEGKLRPPADYDHPVLYVSWQDANEYCKWLSQQTGLRYRLPTEAEWEYAACGGSQQYKYAWGNDPASWTKVANLADESAKAKYPDGWSVVRGYDDGYVFSAPVGSFPPNERGIYDLDGNVREWCSDRYSPNYSFAGPSFDPQGPVLGTERVLRGGSWYYDLRYCRNAYRANASPLTYDFQIGFRIARSKAQPEKARKLLATEKKPTVDMVQEALSDFRFNGLPQQDPTEAKRMLQWIGVKAETIQTRFSPDQCQVWGKLPSGLDVQIWTNTYERGCYGLRFQREDLLNYIPVNETYLPICGK